MLSFVLERLKSEKTEQILLYICTLSPVADDDESVWLGGEEVRKSVIEASASSATGKSESAGGKSELVSADSVSANSIQVIYDCGREFMSDEEMEKEEKILESKITLFSFAKAGE